eukprot:15451342-Alexandrium_andersonii.AAC.1
MRVRLADGSPGGVAKPAEPPLSKNEQGIASHEAYAHASEMDPAPAQKLSLPAAAPKAPINVGSEDPG